MSDSVTTSQLFPPVGNNSSVVVVHLTNKSDGTGESAVKKVDITTLKNYSGSQPVGLRIAQCRWAIQSFTDVQLLWDRTAGSNLAMILSTSGYEDFRGISEGGGPGGVQDFVKLGGLPDPSEGNADNKGSILLTTDGAVNGGSYDITLWLTSV